MSYRDPVFKGCTRPAMWLGVPLPLIISVVGITAVIASVTTLLFWSSLLLIVPVLGAVTRQDDQAYRLFRLRALFRYRLWSARQWQAVTLAPTAIRGFRP